MPTSWRLTPTTPPSPRNWWNCSTWNSPPHPSSKPGQAFDSSYHQRPVLFVLYPNDGGPFLLAAWHGLTHMTADVGGVAHHIALTVYHHIVTCYVIVKANRCGQMTRIVEQNHVQPYEFPNKRREQDRTILAVAVGISEFLF